MNIFVLHEDATEAAYYMLDKHIVKMPTETMQMMCTNLNHLGYEGWLPMKSVMLNHPSTIWMRQSLGNWLWCIEHLEAMLNNYTHTYDRTHMVEKHWDKMSDDVYEFLEHEYCVKINDDVLVTRTPFAMAMPDKYKNDDVVKAYRDYYLGDKWEFATWKARRKPDWWPHNHIQNKKQEMVDEFNRKFGASVKI
tara:strand:- start:200 stop:778 length:579 start_codon:yes stop_codon:yes gene_type:complete